MKGHLVDNMCGIAGYIVTNDGVVRKRKLKALATSLLLGIAERGKEAASYAYVHPQSGFVRIAKEGVSPADFVTIPGHLLSTGSHLDMPRVMILHARFATQGSPTENGNNHPLYTKGSGLCMVHNGWFTNEDEVAKEMGIDRDYEVDSEVYLKLIEHYARGAPVDTAIEKATQRLSGTSACAMIQAKRVDEVWLWRDNFGSLALVKTDFGYVFASTVDTLYRSLLGSLSAFDNTSLELIPVAKGEVVLLGGRGIISAKQMNLGSDKFYWTTNYVDGKRVKEKVSQGSTYTY